MSAPKAFAVYEKKHASGNVGYRVDLGLVNGKRTLKNFPSRVKAQEFSRKCLKAEAQKHPSLLAEIDAVTRHEVLAAMARLYAQEYGVSYSDLHRGNDAAFDEATARHDVGSERTQAIIANLRLVDLSEQKPTPEQILQKIAELRDAGFPPDLVIIDQLEFKSVPAKGTVNDAVVDAEAETFGMAPPLAAALSKAFTGQPFQTWVLYQVDGSARPSFGIGDIVGGPQVTDRFKPVLGIGRTNHNDSGTRVDVRVFSMTRSIPFESVFAADFARMRFSPKK